MSARRQVPKGPDRTCSKATTRMPSRARWLICSCIIVSLRLLGFVLDLGKQLALGGVSALPHHDAARVVDHHLAVLIDSARAHLDDPPLGFRLRLALLDDLGLRIDRVARKDRIGGLDLTPAAGGTLF